VSSGDVRDHLDVQVAKRADVLSALCVLQLVQQVVDLARGGDALGGDDRPKRAQHGLEGLQQRHGLSGRHEAALTDEAPGGVAAERREVVCRVIPATACLDSRMDELVHPLEGQDPDRASDDRISRSWSPCFRSNR